LKGLGDLRRSSFDKILQPYTKSYPFSELGRMFSSKLGFGFLIEPEKGFFV